jgi:hypothetical protein
MCLWRLSLRRCGLNPAALHVAGWMTGSRHDSVRLAVASVAVVGSCVHSTVTVVRAFAPADCYNIRASDKRNECLAETKGKTSYCYNIKDKDGRQWCLATVSRKRSYCYNIRARDLRHACLARVP